MSNFGALVIAHDLFIINFSYLFSRRWGTFDHITTGLDNAQIPGHHCDQKMGAGNRTPASPFTAGSATSHECLLGQPPTELLTFSPPMPAYHMPTLHGGAMIGQSVSLSPLYWLELPAFFDPTQSGGEQGMVASLIGWGGASHGKSR